MADTCIVCLGDLATVATAAPTAEPVVQHEAEPSSNDVSKASCKSQPILDLLQVDPETIAHLLPCGHDLHNECLKPWVERANSCPICRQNFNMVELKSSLHGTCLSSYAVQDKRQIADLDPSMIVEEDIFDESSIEPCLLCEHYGDEEVLLLCDGCCGSCHTYCAGLSAVPAGPWFCQFCLDDPTIQYNNQTRSRPRRTRGQQWRLGSRVDSDAWARVWQSVWDNLNIDLDFPFEEDPETSRRAQHHSREFNEWQQRFRVAESHGAGAAARFRDSAATLLEGRSVHSHSRGGSSHPESQEEISAWNAFDKAREIESSSASVSSNRNKRKSAPTSPIEAQAEPERKLKRPRTRRPREPGESVCASRSQLNSGQGSTSQRAVAHTPGSRLNLETDAANPSFFQSLLKEVETIPKSADTAGRLLQSLNVPPASTDHSSPCSSSPPSSHPSPHLRPISPPPLRSSRPSSPPLTSRIEPIFAQQPQFSPFSPDNRLGSETEEICGDSSKSVQTSARKHRPPSDVPTNQSTRPPQSGVESPTKDQVRYMKAEIQRMVAAALKPAFKKHEIDSDQFTGINRDISRMLYDKVGDAGLEDLAEREKWQIEATHQVDAAVKKLKETNELQAIA